MTNNQQTTNDIGVTFKHCGATVEGVVLSVNWDARTAWVESWWCIEDQRYSWCECNYPLAALTYAPNVRRPCEIYSEYDLQRMCDDGSEALAQAERFDDLQRWLNGYGWGLR